MKHMKEFVQNEVMWCHRPGPINLLGSGALSLKWFLKGLVKIIKLMIILGHVRLSKC